MTASRVPSARGLLLNGSDDLVDGQRELQAAVVETLIASVQDLKGDAAAQRLRADGLEALHHVIDPADLGPLRDRVLEALRGRLLGLAVAIGRSVLGWTDEFYVDDYLILRINIPYEVARKASAGGENPGIGRVSPWMREVAASRRVVDPLYDPKSYHKGHPPAAWAHGPHLDSWAGHSRDGINIWWAMCDVPSEASMVFYPELPHETLPCDRRTLYLAQDYPLPPPTFMPLKAGEMLVFDPEILHGTHLNVTDRTRVAVSMRLNANKPSFDPDCFYAREFWRTASDIDRGRLERVLHVKREDNLGAPVPKAATAAKDAPPTVRATIEAGWARVAPATSLAEGERLVATIGADKVIVTRVDGELRAVQASCPHYGVDLAYGGQRAETMFCPACAVAFDVRDGSSASETLRLICYRVRERDGAIMIECSS